MSLNQLHRDALVKSVAEPPAEAMHRPNLVPLERAPNLPNVPLSVRSAGHHRQELLSAQGRGAPGGETERVEITSEAFTGRSVLALLVSFAISHRGSGCTSVASAIEVVHVDVEIERVGAAGVAKAAEDRDVSEEVRGTHAALGVRAKASDPLQSPSQLVTDLVVATQASSIGQLDSLVSPLVSRKRRDRDAEPEAGEERPVVVVEGPVGRRELLEEGAAQRPFKA